MNSLNKIIGARGGLVALLAVAAWQARAETDVYLLDVPDYDWYAGCFGTAGGNLAGYWDRNGFPNLYAGPTAGGVAPMDSYRDNVGIRSMWASKAGFDGRPVDQPGHIDDYWAYYNDFQYSYEDTSPDPYVTAGRAEHPPDCIGDFIGMSQRKWNDMAGECGGNIDAFSFVFWDKTGRRSVNFEPLSETGQPVRDIPSGLREWARFRGYEAQVTSQLADVNPETPPGAGFTFEDLKAEIDSGHPVLIFLQHKNSFFRQFGKERLNPEMHGMLAYGYNLGDDGSRSLRLRSSWADGDNYFQPWSSEPWVPKAQLSVRGVICYRPLPKITSVSRQDGQITITWDGPSARLHDAISGVTSDLHGYVVERSPTLSPPTFVQVGDPVSGRSTTFEDCCDGAVFFRVRLATPQP